MPKSRMAVPGCGSHARAGLVRDCPRTTLSACLSGFGAWGDGRELSAPTSVRNQNLPATARLRDTRPPLGRTGGVCRGAPGRCRSWCRFGIQIGSNTREQHSRPALRASRISAHGNVHLRPRPDAGVIARAIAGRTSTSERREDRRPRVRRVRQPSAATPVHRR